MKLYIDCTVKKIVWLYLFFNSIDTKVKKQEILMVKIKVRYQLLILIFSMLISYRSTLFSRAFTFKHFWVARKPNFFDPSMALGGAAISFFLTWNFGLKFILGHNFVKKIGCMHFWNHVFSKKLDKMAKKWHSKLCWSLVKTLFFCSKHGKSRFFRLRMAYWMTECYRIKNFSPFCQFD